MWASVYWKCCKLSRRLFPRILRYFPRDIDFPALYTTHWIQIYLAANAPFGAQKRVTIFNNVKSIVPIPLNLNWIYIFCSFKKVTKFFVVTFFSVIQALVALVDQPEPEHPLRADLAEEYIKDKKKFMKNAEEYTKKHSEKRPAD